MTNCWRLNANSPNLTSGKVDLNPFAIVRAAGPRLLHAQVG